MELFCKTRKATIPAFIVPEGTVEVPILPDWIAKLRETGQMVICKNKKGLNCYAFLNNNFDLIEKPLWLQYTIQPAGHYILLIEPDTLLMMPAESFKEDYEVEARD